MGSPHHARYNQVLQATAGVAVCFMSTIFVGALLYLHAATWRFFAALPAAASERDRFIAMAAFHIGMLNVLSGTFMVVSGAVRLWGCAEVIFGIWATRYALTRRSAMRVPAHRGAAPDAEERS